MLLGHSFKFSSSEKGGDGVAFHCAYRDWVSMQKWEDSEVDNMVRQLAAFAGGAEVGFAFDVCCDMHVEFQLQLQQQ